ncbi:MAG: ferrous iron transport protein B [Bacteroidales bacterium]
MTLADLREGEKGIIAKVKGRGAFRKRITEMGFIVGKQVIVTKHAPLRDPIEYNILGYEVSLRKSEARLIEVFTGTDLVVNHDLAYHGVQEIEYSLKLIPVIRKKEINVALIGNPNSGKTTLFNFASKSKERVANYAGVTVEAKTATFRLDDYTFNLTDLPGTYSITSYSPEELFVRNHLFSDVPDIVLNVIDSSNLERNLYLTTQIIDMDMRVVIALNMFDELQNKGDKFDYQSLSKMIGIPVVPTIGSKGVGIEELFRRIIDVYEEKDPDVRHIHVNYGTEIENAIKHIQQLINIEDNKDIVNIISPRYLAIKLLENDKEEIRRISECNNAETILKTARAHSKQISVIFKDETETVITDAKYGFIEGALKETYKKNKQKRNTKSLNIDSILTNKYSSYPIFLAIMWLIFEATFVLGKYPMEWIENLMMFSGNAIHNNLNDSILRDLLVDGIIGGVGGVIVFLPNILILFFFLSLLETTGYMARVAFIVDKLMHRVGLHGRSFIPLLMGFGCNVPAIMATRTIENRSDRLVTMMIIPFMSCSARYPVYILLISAFFSAYQGTLLFGVYLLGIFFAGLLAWVFKKTLFKAQELPFVMELPPYRVPTARAIFKQTWFKAVQYLKKMGTIILFASIAIWALGYFPKGTHIEEKYNQEIRKEKQELDKKLILAEDIEKENIIHENKSLVRALELEKSRLKNENSFIGRIGLFIEPVIKPLGFDWKMGVSLLAGSAAKEIIISTMGVLYETDFEESGQQTLPEKLAGKGTQTAAMTPLAAFSFMIFILIYFPCIAVFAAIKKESGQWKWPLFTTFYTTFLAYLVSLIVFQAGSLLGF